MDWFKNIGLVTSSSLFSSTKQEDGKAGYPIDSRCQAANSVPGSNYAGAGSSQNQQKFIGTVVDVTDDYVTLLSTDQVGEYRISAQSLKIEVVLNATYNCEGKLGQDGIFVLESIKKELNEEKSSRTQATGRLPTHQILFANFPFGQGSPNKKLFNIIGATTNLKMDPPPINDGGGESCCGETTAETETDADELEKGKEDEKGADVKMENTTRPEETIPTAPIANTFIMTKQVPAIVVAFDRVNGNSVLMFAPSQPQFSSLFKFDTQSLEQPIKIGKWYMVHFGEVQTKTDTREVPILEKIAKTVTDERPPLKTRIRNGAVQFYIDAILRKSTEQEGGGGGFLLCTSRVFPPIIDSLCLLNHVKQPPPSMIRHAPGMRIGVWCSPRKFPISNECWKVVGIEPKFRKKMPKPTPEPAREEEKPLKQEKVAEKKEDRSGKSAKKKANLKCESAPSNGEERDGEDGLVCQKTQCGAVGLLVVYSPTTRRVAYLDKNKSVDGFNLIGMWIHFKVYTERNVDIKRNPTGNGQPRRMIEEFRVINPIVLTIPKKDYVLLRCTVEVARQLEPTIPPYCPVLGLTVSDPLRLIKQAHHGRELMATIGCTIEPLEEGEIEGEDNICWEILYLDED